jgi:hypothetical protein
VSSAHVACQPAVKKRKGGADDPVALQPQGIIEQKVVEVGLAAREAGNLLRVRLQQSDPITLASSFRAAATLRSASSGVQTRSSSASRRSASSPSRTGVGSMGRAIDSPNVAPDRATRFEAESCSNPRRLREAAPGRGSCLRALPASSDGGGDVFVLLLAPRGLH